jgi:uncharacterized protein (DUF58 family)
MDTATLMRIKNLELRARVIVEGVLSGLHRSPYHGISVEFTEYRGYTPGDDPRQLDWRVFARSDRYFVKRFEEETNLFCHLVVDRSSSMRFASGAIEKSAYAATVAATLATFLARQRDAVGLTTFADRVLDVLPSRYRPGHLHRLAQKLQDEHHGKDTNLIAPLEQVARLVKRRGLVILVSDFLTPLDGLDPCLGALRSRGHEILLLRILDPREKDFDLSQPSLLVDLETGRELYLDPAEARTSYRRRFDEHAAALARLCADQGVELRELVTDQPLETALLDFLHTRKRTVRRVLRRGQPMRGARP